MSKANYPACLAEVFKHEGGYVNHPSDPGGATNYGITIHTARRHWKRDATPSDIKAMPKAVAADIYRKQYWNKISGDNLPDGIDLCTFDAAVNSGPGRADKWLAYGLNASLRSYPELAKLAQTASDKAAVVKRYCNKRMSFLQSLRTWGTFGRGWTRRVASVKAKALSMVLRSAGKPPEEIKEELGREVAQTHKALQRDVTTGSTGLGTGGATWALDGGLILAGVLVLAATIFIACRIYTHVVVKQELQKEIENVTSDQQVQNLERELLAEGPVLRADGDGQDVSSVQPQE